MSEHIAAEVGTGSASAIAVSEKGVRCMWMRGGTSKGGYFLKEDLPSDSAARDAVLLRAMGSPDLRQIDGMGGADPLTSKVAVVAKSKREGIDVDYLFLQVFVDQPIVTDAQNCGNILAGVGAFAIERGLVDAQDGETSVAIYMENTGQAAVARIATPERKVSYTGDAQIDGVPGGAAAVPLTFKDTAGSSCGALLPTGNPMDVVNGIELTMIDNGMPCVVMRAADMGISGDESPQRLEETPELRAKLEAIRLACGPHIHSASLSQNHWCARRGKRCNCLLNQGHASLRFGRARHRARADIVGAAPERRNDSCGNFRGERRSQRRGDPAHNT